MAGARTSIAAPARSERRRLELLDAADRVIRARGPDASMDEIAAAAGITKPILYRHFGDKSGLLAALAVRYMQRFFHTSEATLGEEHPRRRLATAVDAYLEAVEREPEIFRFVRSATTEQRRALAAAAEELDRHAREVARPITRNLELIGLDPEPALAWAYGVVGMVQFVAGWWVEARPYPRERLVEHLTALLWHGFGHVHEAAGRARP